MSQALSERRPQSPPKIAGRKSASPQTSSPEHLLEMKTRLRIEEENARWNRNKELLIVMSVVIVVVCACVASTALILSGSSTQSDKILAFFVLGQIITVLLSAAVGKIFKWIK